MQSLCRWAGWLVSLRGADLNTPLSKGLLGELLGQLHHGYHRRPEAAASGSREEVLMGWRGMSKYDEMHI